MERELRRGATLECSFAEEQAALNLWNADWPSGLAHNALTKEAAMHITAFQLKLVGSVVLLFVLAQLGALENPLVALGAFVLPFWIWREHFKSKQD